MAKQNGKDSTLEGIVEYLNFSPKGTYEAVLLKVGKDRIQVNFPAELSDEFAEKIKSGDRVTVEVEEYDDDRPGQHPVYSFVSLTGPKGLQIGSTGGVIQGKVERINFAKHGEPNGALLDSGYFVHLKPGGARAIGLKLGQSLEVRGRTKPAAHGSIQVVEAEAVNGLSLANAKDPKKKHAHRTPPPPPPPAKKAIAKKTAVKKQ